MSVIASTTANSMRIAGYYFYAESQQIYIQIVKHYYPPRKSATSVQKVILSDKQ